MRRADRFFEILQLLRRASGPRTADAIANELETSKRTIYRDIAVLAARGVPIRGEAGVGYVLQHGFFLPPLTLNLDEVEAVALGAQWVAAHADPSLARAALDVLAKVAAMLPEATRTLIQDPVVGTPPSREVQMDHGLDFVRLRTWCRQGRKLELAYVDASGHASERTVWPFIVGYVPTSRVLAAWCELREDLRIFRLDRVVSVRFLEDRYPESPTALRRRWLAAMRARRANAEVVLP